MSENETGLCGIETVRLCRFATNLAGDEAFSAEIETLTENETILMREGPDSRSG